MYTICIHHEPDTAKVSIMLSHLVEGRWTSEVAVDRFRVLTGDLDEEDPVYLLRALSGVWAHFHDMLDDDGKDYLYRG